jgi:peptidoglycan L-alanyl-D-glutamate endopeptidase CwlK
MSHAGYPWVGISSTYRCHKAQNTLYAQGRTAPGRIVTNARGGQSIHNYGLAFDFFRNVPNAAFADRTPEERDFWDTAGKIWTDMGGEWGGNWTNFVDRPHCQYTGGLTIADLQRGKTLPMTAIMPWEVEMSNEAEKMATAPSIWAKEAIAWVVGNQLADGERPREPITRQEVFTLLHRFSLMLGL